MSNLVDFCDLQASIATALASKPEVESAKGAIRLVGIKYPYGVVKRHFGKSPPFWRKIGKTIFFKTPIIPKPEVISAKRDNTR